MVSGNLQNGPVAQRLAQGTHNPLVAGSNPAGPTRNAQILVWAFRILKTGTPCGQDHGPEKCNHCPEWKDREEFNWRYIALGIRNPACRDCQHAFNKDYYEGDAKERHLKEVKERPEAAREAEREFVYQYLLSHPSEVCGEASPSVHTSLERKWGIGCG